MGLSNVTISTPGRNEVVISGVVSFWVHDESQGALRQAIIHTSDCPWRKRAAAKGGGNGAEMQWYGPFESLIEARSVSDQLAGVAMRGECRCVRRVVPKDVPIRVLSNTHLFRKPAAAVKPKIKAAEKAPKVAKQAVQSTKTSKGTLSKLVRYAVPAVLAAATMIATLFAFPALSVVEAGNELTNSPFRLANNIPVSLSEVNVQCSAQLAAAAVPLQGSHSQLADRLEQGSTAPLPCFQKLGGSVPQTSGITMQVSVDYGVFGLPHKTQTFVFVAARTANGVSRWALKD